MPPFLLAIVLGVSAALGLLLPLPPGEAAVITKTRAQTPVTGRCPWLGGASLALSPHKAHRVCRRGQSGRESGLRPCRGRVYAHTCTTHQGGHAEV